MYNLFDKKDTQIQEDVINELKWDPSVTATEISATSHDGIVTLRGTVPHYFEKLSAEEAAQRVGGVRAVADEIEVNIMGSFERSDEDIANAAANALEWNFAVPREIKVSVEKGMITLKGETEWQYQRSAAENAVSHLMGVSGVSNQICIKMIAKPLDVKERIEDALRRSAENDGRNIQVEVKGDRIVLSGTVHSYAEVEKARLAAWNAPGILSVENNLKVDH